MDNQLNRKIEEKSFNNPFDNYKQEKDFTSLEAWNKCREVKIYFYKNILPLLPKEEKFNLDIQIRKAAVSITANISEGYGRFYYQEGIQFYRIARGSLYELKDHLISCSDLGYINNEIKKDCEMLIERAKILLNCYISFVKKQITKG